MADHTIVITLVDNIHALCSPEKMIAHVGDTFRFTNPDNRPLKVEFPGSPFSLGAALTIEDSLSRTFVEEGRYVWKCFLRRPSDNEFVGWVSGEEPMESGGDVDVRP